MTTQKLIENATKLNATIYTEQIREDKSEIGIRFRDRRSEAVIHWFTVYTYLSGEISIEFKSSYSQNTGKTKRGIRHQIKVKQRLGFYEN